MLLEIWKKLNWVLLNQTIKTPKLTYTHTVPTLHPIHPIDHLSVHCKTHHGVSHALSPGLHSELYVAVKGDNGAVVSDGAR